MPDRSKKISKPRKRQIDNDEEEHEDAVLKHKLGEATLQQLHDRRLSMDLGPKNLGYCDLAWLKHKPCILEWALNRICKTGKPPIEVGARLFIKNLETRVASLNLFHRLRKILIENQPPRNLTTLVMQYAAFGYLTAEWQATLKQFTTVAEEMKSTELKNELLSVCQPPNVQFVDTHRKEIFCLQIGARVTKKQKRKRAKIIDDTNDDQQSESANNVYASSHEYNKKLATVATIKLLRHFNMNRELEWFLQQPKRDDLADAFIQAMDDYYETHSEEFAELQTHTKKECKKVVSTNKKLRQKLNAPIGLFS